MSSDPSRAVAGRLQVAADVTLRRYFGVDIVPQLRHAHALVAAACATLSAAIEAHLQGNQAGAGACTVRPAWCHAGHRRTRSLAQLRLAGCVAAAAMHKGT